MATSFNGTFFIGVLSITLLTLVIIMFRHSSNTLSNSDYTMEHVNLQGHPTCSCPRSYKEDILNVDPRVKAGVQRLSGPRTTANNTQLVSLIREHFIDSPRPFLTKFSLPLFQTEQAKTVDTILNHKKHGFFIECGALDGERSSNTIWLEQQRGWNGLLIEMDPSYYLQIRGKNRKCYSINACLSPQPYPTIMPFKEHKMGEGRLMDNPSENKMAAVYDTFCFPFLSMMLALNITHVDYFSLDVEGLELTILKTIPFDLINISVFTVEFIHGPDHGAGYIDFMKEKGYTLHSKISAFKKELYYGANDYVFVKL